MRRQDREIADMNEIIAVIRSCSVCRIALFDDGYPYIVPLSYGFEASGGQLTLWFHCAHEGRKIDLLKRNPQVAFEMDRQERYIDGEKACESTMEFSSVCGTGTLEIAGEEEKLPALKLLMRQYSDKTDFLFDDKALAAVAVLKLTVDKITGKRLTRG